ncbi:MAG: hypothetical protein K0S56_867, partial [Microvirga sp.]|nr:hypothetical protein [Microvirga sp.]
MSEKYSIGMNVYGGGFTGHTNVTLTSNVNGVVASKTYGGQVDSWSTSLLGTTGVLDGKVVPENEKKLTEPHATFEISLTKEQYDKVFGLAESTLGQQFDYDLYNQNCVTYAQSLYKAAGLLGHFSGNFTFEDYQKTKSLVWSIMKPNAQIKWDLIQSKYILGLGLVDTFGAQVHCFPAGTLISIAGGATREIESLAPGDLVVAFDQKGVLLPGAIARLFRNVTSEWLILSCGLTVTPGHRFLNECGEFERIDQLTARGGKVVLEDGSLQSVTAERIVYSDATRHLYEEAEEAVYQSAGGAALQPEIRRGWRTYNFEVEEYHTYIAGGVRVHNDSLQDYLNLSVMMKNDAYTAVAIDDMVDHFGWGAVGSASWSSEPFTQASFEAHANAMVEAHREAVAMRDFKTANGILEGFDSLASGARAAAQENARAQAENQRSAALPQIQAEGRNIARGAGVIDQARKAMGGVVVPDGGTAVGSGDGYSNHTPDINGPPEHDDPNDGDGVPGTAPPGGGENLSAGNRPDESSDADAENANPVTYTAGPATITRHADGTVYSEVNSGKKRSFATVRDKDVLALGEANVLGDGRTEENTKTALIGGGMQETTTIYSRAGGMLSQTVKARKILRQKFETHDNGTKTLDEYSRSGLLEHQILIEKNGSGWFWEINLKPKAGEFRTKKTFFNKKGVSTYALLTFKNGPSEIESYQKSFELSPKIQLLTLIGEARNGMGNALANLIKGNDQKNVLQGLAGNDTLRGMDGNDSLNGGLGDDRLEGGEGHDILEGEDGADVLLGGEGDDRLNGGAGSDDLAGDDGDDTLEGGAGDDTLAGGKGDDVLRGDAGADNLEGGAGADFLDGGEGADVLRGGAGNDRLWGGAGNDVLSGEDGNDGLNGADGDDRLEGGLGDDQLLGGGGNDILAGDGGDDLLVGGAGQDSLSGGDGHDELEGMEGDDSLSGNAGSDTLRGGAGADTLNGGDGTDVMAGGDGADSLNGGIGDDQLSGGAGNDTLDGGEGHDQLLGGAGNDRLIGGPGVDFLDGGDGEDTIVLSGVRSDYLIRYNAAIGRYSILDLRTGSPDGTDLAGIELFQFSDGLMSASVLNYIVGTDAATAWNVDNADGSQTTIAWTVSPSDPVKWDATITHYNHGGANKE